MVPLSPESDLKRLAAIARDSVREVWEKVSEKKDHAKAVHVDLPHDVKLDLDFLLEKEILIRLTDATGFPAVGEEGWKNESEKLLTAPYLWVLDPLDGTVNFSRGIPIYGISVALLKEGVPVLGVIYDLPRDEIYWGYSDANVNEAMITSLAGSPKRENTSIPISVSAVATKSQSILLTGFPVSLDVGSMNRDAFFKRVEDYKKIRMLGCASISLAMVASGKADVYLENRVKIWDIAAGLALVKAAGGSFTLKPHAQPWIVDAVATNGKLGTDL